MDAMLLDCTSCSHQSEDARNCLIYVTFIVTITFIMFLLKLRTLSAAIFAISFVTFENYIRMRCCAVMFVWYQITWCQTNLMF